jgi:hypothetical protein
LSVNAATYGLVGALWSTDAGKDAALSGQNDGLACDYPDPSLAGS